MKTRQKRLRARCAGGCGKIVLDHASKVGDAAPAWCEGQNNELFCEPCGRAAYDA